MYNAASHLSSSVTWDNDWVHFGTNIEIKFKVIDNLVNTHLNSNAIIFINGRTNSEQLERDLIIERIKPFLWKASFQIWNMSMDKVIQFDKIGVLRLGAKHN